MQSVVGLHPCFVCRQFFLITPSYMQFQNKSKLLTTVGRICIIGLFITQYYGK